MPLLSLAGRRSFAATTTTPKAFGSPLTRLQPAERKPLQTSTSLLQSRVKPVTPLRVEVSQYEDYLADSPSPRHTPSWSASKRESPASCDPHPSLKRRELGTRESAQRPSPSPSPASLMTPLSVDATAEASLLSLSSLSSHKPLSLRRSVNVRYRNLELNVKENQLEFSGGDDGGWRPGASPVLLTTPSSRKLYRREFARQVMSPGQIRGDELVKKHQMSLSPCLPLSPLPSTIGKCSPGGKSTPPFRQPFV